MEMSRASQLSAVIGEGGSGGALGIGIGDRFAMLEHAYYSVISPKAAQPSSGMGAKPSRADALKLTAKELLKLKPMRLSPNRWRGHRNIHDTIYNVEQFITKSLAQLKRIPSTNWL